VAGLKTITNKSGVRMVTRTGPGGKERIESFHIVLYEELLDATLVQLRVVAEETRELVIDKLYGGAVAPPGSKVVARPRRLRRSRIPSSERRPYKHKKLAKRTVLKKVAAEEDGRRLIATGEYTYGIEVFKGQKQGQPYYTVRPKPGNHSGRKIPHRVLAAMHEFGTSTMPKRPHWAPALRIAKRVLKNQSADVRAVALRKALRRAR